MRHKVAHRKLGRITPHRTALLRTLAKREDNRLHARRLVSRDIQDPVVVKKLFDSLGARYATRPGGYTRILRLGARKGDGAEMAIVELLGSEWKPKKGEEKGKKAAAKDEDKKESAPKARGGKKAKGEAAAAE